MEKAEKAIRTLLPCMFVVVLFVSSLTLIGAFSNHRLASEMVKRTLTDCRIQLEKVARRQAAECTKDTLPALDQAYLDQLRSASSSALGSETISFLFTVFSVFIISASVYALMKACKALENATEYATMGKDAGLATAIASHLCTSHHIAIILSAAGLDPSVRNANVSMLRETVHDLRGLLEGTYNQGVGMDRAQWSSFFDILTRMKSLLENLPYRNEIQDILTDCEKAWTILKETDFVHRFEEKLKGLTV
jgi:hypothetical protein